MILSFVLLFGAGLVEANESDATLVVQRYFQALHDGDVESIRGILGGRLLARKERLLSNPTYGDYLRNHYQDLSVSITSTAVESGAVEVMVDLRGSERGEMSLWLKLVQDPETGIYRIEEEREGTSDS